MQHQMPLTNLGFIKQVKNLAYLKIRDRRFREEKDILINTEIFSIAIPSLTILDFDGKALDRNSFPFHTYFPNLMKMYIRDLESYKRYAGP